MMTALTALMIGVPLDISGDGAERVASVALPQAVTLVRKFVPGETDPYDVVLTMETASGEVEMHMRLNEKTLRQDGVNGEMEYGVSQIKTLFNGVETRRPGDRLPPTWKVLLSHTCKPLKNPGQPSSVFILKALSSAFLFAMLPEKAVSVGSSYGVDWKDPSGDGVVKGTSTVAEVDKDLVRITSKLSWKRSESPAMDFQVTSWVDLMSGKTVKGEGHCPNPSGPAGTGLKALRFRMQRVAN